MNTSSALATWLFQLVISHGSQTPSCWDCWGLKGFQLLLLCCQDGPRPKAHSCPAWVSGPSRPDRASWEPHSPLRRVFLTSDLRSNGQISGFLPSLEIPAPDAKGSSPTCAPAHTPTAACEVLTWWTQPCHRRCEIVLAGGCFKPLSLWSLVMP